MFIVRVLHNIFISNLAVYTCTSRSVVQMHRYSFQAQLRPVNMTCMQSFV